jgi:hypothetical protein
MQILVRTTHYAILGLLSSYRNFPSIIYLNESIELSLVSMETSCVSLGSRFPGFRQLLLHTVENIEHFTLPMHFNN